MNKSKSTLFLMELIIVILFFAISSAVCLQIFVHAHKLGTDTKDTNYAVLWADNAAELFYEYGAQETEAILLKDYLSTAPYSNEYDIILSFNESDGLSCMHFDFIKKSSNESVYSFTFKKHIQEVAD